MKAKLKLHKLLSLLLALVMVVGMLPMGQVAYAAGSTFTVTFTDGGNTTFTGEATVIEGTAYTCTIVPDAGYKLEKSYITVKCNRVDLNAADWTYDAATGKLEIAASAVTDNITIYAKAADARVDVTFTNGGNTTFTGEAKVIKGTAYTCTIVPDAGYELAKNYITVKCNNVDLNSADWTYDAATGELVIAASAVTGYIRIYAKAVEKNIPVVTYTVSFAANGGTGTMAAVIGVSGEYTLPANGFTAPAGKQFKAWSVGGVEKAAGDMITVTANTTVTAVWEAVEYNVTVTGGTASVGAGTPITKATMGTTVTLTAGAAPTGQMFDKWVVNGVVVDDANSATTTFVMPAGNVTAEATYKNIPVVTYTVTFNANGGTGSMADATGVSGDYVLPVCGFTAPNGKQFKAWSVGGVEKAAGDTITVNANTTVTAIWENIPVTYYTVTFDSNGGSAVTAQSIEAGQKATKPADPTKDGFDFKGWTLNGSAYDFNTAVNGNITLVATWEQQQVVPTTYTVSFAANGGTGTMADVTGISGEYTLPENGFTAPDGKQFKAWSVDGNEKAVGDKITVTADTTVTAVWEDIPAGHTCDIKPVAKVEPSCTEGGKEAYYKCEGCGKFYEDALGTKEITDLASWGNLDKLGHTESDWKSDKDNHWKECTVAGCGVIIENSKAAHADANNDGKCDTCEYNVGIPTTPGGDKPNDNPQTGDNSMMWLWIALLFVSGFGVVTTTVYTKKRKSVK